MSRVLGRTPRPQFKKHWYSPGMLLAGVLLLVLYLIGVPLTLWWVWLVVIVFSIVVDALLGVSHEDTPKIKTQREYTRGVQDDDDLV